MRNCLCCGIVIFLCIKPILHLIDYQNQHKRKAESSLENDNCSKLRRTLSEPFYIKLQDESPLRSDNIDESSYDSFHDRETGK